MAEQGGIGYLPRMWEMEVLLGSTTNYDSATRETTIDGGEWCSLRPAVPEGAPPWRFDYRKDAESCLARLYPELPQSHKRVVRV